MSATREAATARAVAALEDGSYIALLSRLVAIETESQTPAKAGELLRYWEEGLAPEFKALGFATERLPGIEGAPPAFLASRIEDPARPTVMVYGHGDVVAGQKQTWRAGLDPWVLCVEGERIYGRGTADNKGQHLIALEALRAVFALRGKLGFNVKFFVESGEELGSPGIAALLAANRARLACDAFIGLDGPRQSLQRPEMRLGARGGVTFELVVDLREGAFHSGHWGGVLPDAGLILTSALGTIVDGNGVICVEGWRPAGIPRSVRDVCARVEFEQLDELPEIDPGWGEPGLSKAEKIYAWTSVVLLAMEVGNPRQPLNAVQGKAWARLQVRHDVGIDGEGIIPALRAHLDRLGYGRVQIRKLTTREMFPASRTDPEDAWVQAVGASLERTTGMAPNIVPNSSGGNPSGLFRNGLDVPVIWIPHSYAACGQHGPDEHALVPLVRQGLAMMAGLFWDLGADWPIPGPQRG